MAEKKIYIGSAGPFLYDDEDLINDSDGDFSGQTYGALVGSGIFSIGGIALDADSYITFGGYGESQYGIRDNSGIIESKDLGGSWAPLGSAWKVGSYYFNSGNNPATELGYGTWEQVAKGLFLVGHT